MKSRKAAIDHPPRLIRDERGLALAWGKTIMRGDFTPMTRRLKQDNLSHELLVRAARIRHGSKNPTAVDATAGLGEDALLLAAAGFSVLLFERNSIIAALLEDALMRATQNPELALAAGRMKVIAEDSIEALPRLDAEPDVVLLDPMFPAKQKSAAAKKKLQLLQQLEGPCPDEAELFEAATAAHPRKIVVKRPAKGPHLANRSPDYAIEGKAIRFDCYVLPR